MISRGFGPKYIDFFAECGTQDGVASAQRFDAQARVHENSPYAKITLSEPEDGDRSVESVTLNLTEEVIDDLRRLLYEVAKQLMFDRNKRELQACHELARQEEEERLVAQSAVEEEETLPGIPGLRELCKS